MNDYAMDHLGIAMSMINGRPLTDGLLEEILGKLSQIDSSINQIGLKRVRDKLESTIGIRVSVGEVIRADNHEPWLLDAKGKINWHYWDSYKQLLISQGWGPNVVRVLDEDTDNIITECGNPTLEGSWNIRGLVMGDVQSGKTASYSGVIAKAADSGYKVIVLLTGMIEELRKQTQERLDSTFVGRDSREIFGRNRNMQAIGAGIYRSKSANVLTSVDSDFLSANAQVLGGIPLMNINEPILFVIKKNVSPLTNLNEWLEGQRELAGLSKHQLPLLIIDDEADNASVNVRKDGEKPAAINALIRAMLSQFSRSSYVAYTATPFANIFISPDDENDLFPANFIYSLNTPSHYIGASSIFMEDGKHHQQLRDIEDVNDSFPHIHKKDHLVSALPDSLKEAIRVFFLSSAIRDIRGEELRHRSMLVNVSRFTDVQGRIAEKVREFLWALQEEVRQYLMSISWKEHPDLVELENVYQAEFFECGIGWEEVRSQLNDSIASIKVVTINQKSADEEKLDYTRYKNTEKGRRVIAIGGLTLSRGLTLEGLSVSYFYRNSKAYDTLLQMGRWFGYRQGYEDLFRIWMDTDAQDWYAHIANAVSELRMHFRRMSANRLPPSRFGIRVRAHADSLIVTAQNKMRSGEEVEHCVSYTSFGVETVHVPQGELNNQNIVRAATFIASEGAPALEKNRYVWYGVDKKNIAKFLSDLNISNMNMQFLSDAETGERPLLKFIFNNGYSDLQKWDVCVPQGLGIKVPRILIKLADGQPAEIQCRRRQFQKKKFKAASYLTFNKQRVGDVSDEMVGMSDTQIDEVKANWIDELRKDPEKGESIPGYMYRSLRTRPLLTIHFIEGVGPGEKAKLGTMMEVGDIGTDPILAISVSFPNFDPDSKDDPIVYRLNKVALRELFGEEDDDADDID